MLPLLVGAAARLALPMAGRALAGTAIKSMATGGFGAGHRNLSPLQFSKQPQQQEQQPLQQQAQM